MTEYAERSLAWKHGEKTEDELLQRIWNLAGDVTTLTQQLVRAERRQTVYLDWATTRIAELEAALARVAEQQPKTLAMIKSNGFVFDSIGREPGNWQHLAFTIYTDLCEVDTIARAALAGEGGPAAEEDG